jgi:hypothetical protein
VSNRLRRVASFALAVAVAAHATAQDPAAELLAR